VIVARRPTADGGTGVRALLDSARGRSVFLLALCCVLLLAVGVKLFWLQVMRQRSPESVAAWRTIAIDEEGRRGDLVDARGGIVATSVREVDLRVWTSGVAATDHRREQLAAELARIVGVDPQRTLRTLAKPGQWVLLAEGIRDPGVIAELRDLARRPAFRALELETRHVREHPRGGLFATQLGWVGWVADVAADGKPLATGNWRGVAGLEARCEAVLRPSGGARFVRRDGTQHDMLDPALAAVGARDGRAVHLTLDPLAQTIVDEQLAAAMEEFAPDWAQVLVLDPRTSDVLAIGQQPAPAAPMPDLKPLPRGASAAQRAAIEAENLRRYANHQMLAVHRVYPPGSSFKPLMLGLVLEQGKATPDDVVDCENGSHRFDRRPIRDTHPRGLLTVTEVLVESSNIGMTKLVLSLVPADAKKGAKAFQPVLDHLDRLGFGHKVGGFAGEENGMVPPLRSMDRVYSLASLSFGQQIQVTALQMATACSVIVNDGVWRAPRILDAIDDGAGGRIEIPPAPESERVVFSARTAAQLRGMCARVVDDGATRRWKPKGWSVGGKTGTAEHETDHSISTNSFWCFAPVAAPRFLVLAVLHHPRKGRYAADNAGKLASKVLGGLLERFEVPPDRPEELVSAGPKAEDGGAAPAGRRPLASAAPGVIASPAVGEGR